MHRLRKTVLVRFERDSGIINVTMEGTGTALLKAWSLQNTRSHEDTIIFDKENGNVVMYVEGSEDFPEITENDGSNIEDYCKGLLAEVNK